MNKNYSIKYPWAKPMFVGQELDNVLKAVESTWISGGKYVERFEKDFAKSVRSPYFITTSSGTTALYLAVLGLGIGPGDEVIMPGYTFAAIANMVITVGAIPVFCDIDPDTWCIDPASAERALTKRTKAICAVHTYGNVCDMDALAAICRKHNLFLIEDAAEAAFSQYKNQFVGTLSDAGAFSFHATKTIAMGEGGGVTVKLKDVYALMNKIRNHGMDRSKYYWHSVIGHNFRLTNIHAAIGCAQLKKRDIIVQRKKNVDRIYRRVLNDVPGLSLQRIKDEVDPVIWAFAVKLDRKIWGKSRDDLMAILNGSGIETRPGFYPLHLMPIYRKYLRSPLPVSLGVGAGVLSLPSFPQLTEKQIIWICDQLLRLRK